MQYTTAHEKAQAFLEIFVPIPKEEPGLLCPARKIPLVKGGKMVYDRFDFGH